MREELYSEISAMEQEHWWFVARHRIVLDLLKRYLPFLPWRWFFHCAAAPVVFVLAASPVLVLAMASVAEGRGPL
jgi:hypothetical protein